jgi:hypothetical protein
LLIFIDALPLWIFASSSLKQSLIVGCIASEHIQTHGHVTAAVGVVLKRLKTDGRVAVAG